MSLPRRTLALALALHRGIGGRSLTRILTRNDLVGRSPMQFLKLSKEALREEYRLNQPVAQSWIDDRERLISEAVDLEGRMDRLGVQLVTTADAHYPPLIEAFDPDPPGHLFLYGNLQLLGAKTFSVLSSRKAPQAALTEMEELVEAAVLNGETLVSGHDTPEYQRSAIVPLRWGAPRIIVLDRGLFRAMGEHLTDEPFRSARLWRYEFDPKTDLVITATKPDQDYHPNANRVRDGLIASLSQRIDIVWMTPGGNMERLTKRALKAGRAVRVSDRIIEYRAFADLGAKVLTA